jgi:DNA polymerase-3 subunit delta
VHLVKGDDPVLRNAAVDRLVAELLGEESRDLALEDYTVPGRRRAGAGAADEPSDADDAAGDTGIVQAIVTALASPPFVTSRRVVVVREAGALNAAAGEAIAPFVAEPSDGIALVLVAGGGRMASALEKALKATGAPTIAPESERTDSVLKSEARRVGIGFTAPASQLVTDHLGEDAGRVIELVALLHGAFGDGATIDVDDVEPHLGEAGGVPRYELTNAIDRGDTAAALDTLHRLLTATSARDPRPLHPMQLVATLVPHYQRMLRLDDPAIRTEQDAVAALGGKVKPYPARRAMESARRHGTEGLHEAFGHLAQAELDLRGATGADNDTVIEVLVARLASLARRRGAGAAAPSGGKRRR